MLDYLLEILLQFREETIFLVPDYILIENEVSGGFIKWCLDLVIVHGIDTNIECPHTDNFFKEYYNLETLNTFDDLPNDVLEKIILVGALSTSSNIKTLLMPTNLLMSLDYPTLRFFIEHGYKEEIKKFFEIFYYWQEAKDWEINISSQLIDYICEIYQEEKLNLNYLIPYVYEISKNMEFVAKLVELHSEVNQNTGKKKLIVSTDISILIDIKKNMDDQIYLKIEDYSYLCKYIENLEEFLQVLAPDLRANPVDAQMLFFRIIVSKPFLSSRQISFFTLDILQLVSDYVEIPDPHSLLFYSLFAGDSNNTDGTDNTHNSKLQKSTTRYQILIDFFIRNGYNYQVCTPPIDIGPMPNNYFYLSKDNFFRNYTNLLIECPCFTSLDKKLFCFVNKEEFMKFLGISPYFNKFVELVVDNKINLDEEELTFLAIFAPDESSQMIKKYKQFKLKFTDEILKTIPLSKLISFVEERNQDDDIIQIAELINRMELKCYTEEEAILLNNLCNTTKQLIDWNNYFVNNIVYISNLPMFFLKMECDISLIIDKLLLKLIEGNQDVFYKLERFIENQKTLREYPKLNYPMSIDQGILNKVKNKYQRKILEFGFNS
jgi:hypothetical protein